MQLYEADGQEGRRGKRCKGLEAKGGAVVERGQTAMTELFSIGLT